MLKTAQFRAVIGMVLLVMIGFGIIVPGLPAFAKEFGVGEAGVGVVVFAFSLTRLFGDVFAGSLIDRYGERLITTIGIAITGLSSLAAGAAQSFGQLVVLRAAGGIGSAFFLGGLMAYLIGTTPAHERGRAMSIFQASFGLGFLIGPLIGGLILAATSPNMPLYVYGVVCLVCVPLTLRALGRERVPAAALSDTTALMDNPAPAARPPAWQRLKPLLRNSSYRAALVGSALMFLLGQALFTILPTFWTDVLIQSKASLGIPFAVGALLGLVVVLHAGSLTDRRGRKFAMVPALAVTALGTAAMGLTGSAIALVGLMALTGAAGGYMRPGPSAIVGDVSDETTRGVAVSGFRIAGDIGALIGPIVAGTLAEYVSYKAAFLALGAITAAGTLIAAASDESLPSPMGDEPGISRV